MMQPNALAIAVLAAGALWAGTGREELLALRASLAAQRTLGRASGLAAELNFAIAHKGEPDLAAEVLYDVALAQRENEPAAAAKTLETLLETFPAAQPWATQALYELGRALATRTATQPKAIECFEKYLASNPADPVRRADALLSVARLYQAASKHAEATARYRAFIEQFPDRARQCAEALAAIGVALVEQKQPKEAYAFYQQLLAQYPWEAESRRSLLLAIAQAFRTSEDHENAVAAYDKLLRELPPADQRRPQVYMGLGLLYIQKGESHKAAEVYRRVAADKALGYSYRTSAYRQLFDLQRKVGENAGVIRLAYEIIAAQPSATLHSSSVLGELVDALVAEGRVDEALAMAKAQWRLAYLAAGAYAASSGSSSSGTAGVAQDAIFAVVRALKAKEGSLRAASRFIAFVEHGPEGPDGILGNADDIADPTAGYPLPPDPERDKAFAAAAERFVSEPLELAFLYLCWDRPHDALRAFRRHYLEGGTTDLSGGPRLPRAAALLAHAMRAVGRPEAEVEAFFDLQNLGPAGKDGKLNTKDDLKDPILALPK